MSRHPILAAFLLALAVFAWVHVPRTFGDPDAYYHLEMAKLTAASGAVREFPWLPFTTLADHFADHHFLYHVALAPFLAVFGDFWGLKTATVLFAALAVAAFCHLLTAYGLRRPLLWTLPLLLASGFIFRLALTKATALALAAFFLFLVALKRGNRAAVFGIAFAYVWLHGGWPLLLVAAAIQALFSKSSKPHGREVLKQWGLLALTFLGLAAGLIINPFFPDDLFFFWEQIVQIAVLGRRDPAIQVGNEWHPADLGSVIAENAFVFLPLVASAAALAAAILTGQQPWPEAAPGTARRRDILFASALAALFLLMTLRQVRHLEYFLPVFLLASALLTETVFGGVAWRLLLARARDRLGWLAAPVLLAAGVLLGAAVPRAWWMTHRLYAERPPWARFEQAGAWMRGHVPTGEIVFHVRWDDFPQLFYRDPSHRYIAGLDAMFLYRKDPARYWLWRDIGEGRQRAGLADLIRSEFSARHVLMRMEPNPLRSLMKKDPSFERVYADAEAEVWRITR